MYSWKARERRGEGSHIPCDQVQEAEIAFGQATDLDALADTLEALGFTGIRRSQTGQHALGFDQGRFDGSTLTFYDERRAPEADVLARAYTKAVMVNNADRFGWAVKAKAKAIVGFSRSW
jgi:hypothetical protein